MELITLLDSSVQSAKKNVNFWQGRCEWAMDGIETYTDKTWYQDRLNFCSEQLLSSIEYLENRETALNEAEQELCY
jgi:hypothetical protein